MLSDAKELVTQVASLRRAGDRTAARQVLQEGLTRFSDDVTVQIQNASLFMDEGRYGEAAPLWEAILEKMAGSAPPGVFEQMIKAYDRAGQADMVLSTLERARARKKVTSFLCLQAASHFRAKGEAERAAPLVEEALALTTNPEERISAMTLWLQHAVAGKDPATAKSIVARILAEDPAR